MCLVPPIIMANEGQMFDNSVFFFMVASWEWGQHKVENYNCLLGMAPFKSDDQDDITFFGSGIPT